MTENIIQFAPLFDAVGAELNLRGDFSVEIVVYPKGKKKLVEDAVEEISHYLDTRTTSDALAMFAIADYVAGQENLVPPNVRIEMLESLGLMKSGRYVTQVIALNKINKSWHTSEVANECSYFGDLCVRRGVEDVPGKRGRKSTREPNEYHVGKGNGLINREQLVTPSVEALHRAIPTERLISATKTKESFKLEDISGLDPEKLQAILDKVNAAMNGTK